MGLPCFKYYYMSAQIKPLILWCNFDHVAKWKSIELSLLNKPIQSLISNPGVIKQYNLQNQWVEFSMKIWIEVVNRFKLHKEILVLIWPVHDSDYKPAMIDRSYETWERQGITTLCLLLDNEGLIDFETMSERHDLGRHQFYKYLQLRHYYEKNIKNLPLENISSITQMFIKSYKSKILKKIIGELYWNLIKLNGISTHYIKEKWEKEMGK